MLIYLVFFSILLILLLAQQYEYFGNDVKKQEFQVPNQSFGQIDVSTVADLLQSTEKLKNDREYDGKMDSKLIGGR